MPGAVTRYRGSSPGLFELCCLLVGARAPPHDLAERASPEAILNATKVAHNVAISTTFASLLGVANRTTTTAAMTNVNASATTVDFIWLLPPGDEKRFIKKVIFAPSAPNNAKTPAGRAGLATPQAAKATGAATPTAATATAAHSFARSAIGFKVGVASMSDFGCQAFLASGAGAAPPLSAMTQLPMNLAPGSMHSLLTVISPLK